MTAVRIIESSGSFGTLQLSSGDGGFLPGSLIAGTNIVIQDNQSGSFTISSEAVGSGSILATDELVVTKISANIPGGKCLVAGAGIEIQKTLNTVVFSAPAFESSRKKLSFFMTEDISALTPLRVISSSFDSVNYDDERIDVLFNGQLLHTGSINQVENAQRDYYINGSDYLVFSFPISKDDIVDTIVNKQKYTTSVNAADINGSYIILSATGSLPFHRVLTGSSGIAINDGGPGQNVEIKLQKELVFNELLSGSCDGINTQFSLRSSPFNSSSISIFVNGQLQTPQCLSLDFYDYFTSGSTIFFTSGSTPGTKSILLSIYEKLI